MKLKRGIRYQLTGAFETQAGDSYDFEGTIRIAEDSIVALAGKLGLPDEVPRPNTAGYSTERVNFHGVLVNGDRVQMTGVLLVGVDFRFVASPDNEFEVHHHSVVVEGPAHTPDEQGAIDVQVEWTFGPSLTIAGCGKLCRIIDQDLYSTLGREGMDRRDQVKSPLSWENQNGILSMVLQERQLDQFVEIPEGLAKGYPSRLTYFAPTATFRALGVDAADVQSTIEQAHQWVDDLLVCMAVLERRWVPMCERLTTTRHPAGRSSTSVWEHRRTRAGQRDDAKWQPAPWIDADKPARLIALMLRRYREHRTIFDAAIDAWVNGRRSGAIESMLVHLIIAVEALKNIWEKEAPGNPSTTDLGLSRSERRAVREEVARVLTTAGIPADAVEKMACGVLANRLSFDEVLQELVVGWEIDVDDLWPPPDAPEKRRFGFVKTRNELVHGRSIREEPIDSHFDEVQRLRKFVPLLFEKALRAEGLARFMGTMETLCR
jgi:hypothetical protein